MGKFRLEENGYSKEEVNQFIDEVISQTEKMTTRIQTQDTEIKKLKKELEYYEEQEETIKNAIIKAEETSNLIRKNALEEKEKILKEAKNDASSIVNEALLKAEEIKIKTENMEKNIKVLKRKLRLIVEQQLEVIEDLEDIKLEEK